MNKNIELSLTQDEFETIAYWYQWMKENHINEQKDDELFNKMNNIKIFQVLIYQI